MIRFLQVFNYVYQEVFKKEVSQTHILISHFIYMLAYLSSALNPFIYSYMSEAFRTNFQLELNNCCCFKDAFTSDTTFRSESSNKKSQVCWVSGKNQKAQVKIPNKNVISINIEKPSDSHNSAADKRKSNVINYLFFEYLYKI